MPLTLKAVKAAEPREKDYKASDEKGLYMLVKKTGSKCWRFKYRFEKKEKVLSFGVFPEVSLTEARVKRDDARTRLREGKDPGLKKKAVLSFKDVGIMWGDSRQKTSEKNEARLNAILENDLYPEIGLLPIDSVPAPTLLAAIRKIEARGTIETAYRANQYAGHIFRFGIASGLSLNDPSRDIKDALKEKPKAEHKAAILDPIKLGALLRSIDAYSGTAVVCAAIRLLPMLICRPTELRHLERDEINWAKKRIEIPASKMKMENDHVIPLSSQALNLLKEHLSSGVVRDDKYVFPSPQKKGRVISENTLMGALCNMGYDSTIQTPHGFRACARTLLDEELEFRVDWIEHQLAHAVKDANGRAYNRTKHLKQRAEMMQAWSDYLDKLKITPA